jgi:hypothetical protein
VIHMQMAELRAHAAFKSCGAAEHGIPLSCTQPGGGGGHGLPSGVCRHGERERENVHGRASVLFGRSEHFHVSMLHVPFGPWQLTRANSQGDV